MPFSWCVASLFAVDAARTLKKPNILLFFPDEWREYTQSPNSLPSTATILIIVVVVIVVQARRKS